MTEKEALMVLEPHIPKYASSVIMEAWQLVKEKFTPTNSSLVPCPTCGSACRIYSSNEGTNSFEPVTPYMEQNQ